MKRRAGASEHIAFNKGTRIGYNERLAKHIHGQIESVVFPKFEDAYAGFFIGTIGGYNVIGKLPFLDRNFIFHLICIFERSRGRNKAQYRIVDFEKLAFEPVRFNFYLLKYLMVETLGMSDMESDRELRELDSRVSGLMRITDNMNPDQLLRLAAPLPDWLQEISESSLIFKFNSLKNLTYYWASDDLAKLTVQQLTVLCERVEVDIARFCFKCTTMFDLPDVPYENAKTYYSLTGKAEPDWLFPVWRLYDNMRNHTRRSKQLSVDPAMIYNAWHCGAAVNTALSKSLVKLVPLRMEKTVSRFLCEDDSRKLDYVAYRLNELQSKPVDAMSTVSGVRLSGLLNDEQKAAVNAIFHTNLLIVTGPGGTGKTRFVAKQIADFYGKLRFLALAYYGSIAADLSVVFGRGMTVHKFREEVARGNINEKVIEIVYLDEGSTVTLDLLYIMLRCLPNLKKLVISGDPRQMSPPTPGPIFNDLLTRYHGTPVIRELSQIMRVQRGDNGEDAERRAQRVERHRDALNKLYQKDFACQFSRELDSDSPFVVVDRIDPPNGETGLESLKASIEPVIEYYRERGIFQTLAQKNAVVDQLNQVLFESQFQQQADYDHLDIKVNERVMLLENNYNTYEPSAKQLEDPNYDREKDVHWLLRTSEVCNGQVLQIKEIVDIHPGSLRATRVRSTAALSTSHNDQRVVRFENGIQVNLRNYPLKNLKRGEACTIAKSQGLQFPVVLIYIHQGFSKTFSVKQLSTAIGRGSERFIIVCKRFERLENSEIGTIIQTSEPYIEPLLGPLLEPYKDPIYMHRRQH